MNYTLKLAMPCYYYRNSTEIKPNLRRGLVYLEELEVMSDEIEIIKDPLPNFEPFTKLVKVIEEDKPTPYEYSVRGYYLVGELDLNALKMAIGRRLIGKRVLHPAFSDKPLRIGLETVAISYDDTRYLVEMGRGTKLIERNTNV